MSDRREQDLGDGVPIGLCLSRPGRKAKGGTGQTEDGAAESDDRESGTGTARVRTGDGDDELQPTRRLQGGLCQFRCLDHSERRGHGRSVRAADPADSSHGGRQSLQTAGQKVSTGG